MERRNMDKDKFNKAIEINNKIEEYKDHKMALENSNIKIWWWIDIYIQQNAQ